MVTVRDDPGGGGGGGGARPPRRSQHERRSATIDRLVTATLSALLEVGYHRTSINEVSRRAGVSHGGLFRHFPTRLDLIEAAYRSATAQQLETFRARFADDLVEAASDAGDDALRWAIVELQGVVSDPRSIALHELHAAARTDVELRHRLQPLLDAYLAEVHELATTFPLAATFPADRYHLGIEFFIHTFTGLATVTALVPTGRYHEAVVDLAVELAHALRSPPEGRHGAPDVAPAT